MLINRVCGTREMMSKTVMRLIGFKLPNKAVKPIYIRKDILLMDFAKGKELAIIGKYRQAIECFDKCLRIFENIKQSCDIQYYLAKEKKAYCLLKQCSYDLYEKEISELIQLTKRHFKGYVYQAYVNYLAFLSFNNLSKANLELEKIMKDNIPIQIKDYFNTESALINYLNNNQAKAIDISNKILKQYSNDSYLYALNSHNLGVMTKDIALIKQANNAFTSINKDQHKYNYGLTIVELCKRIDDDKQIEHQKGSEAYFNKGLNYFNTNNSKDNSKGAFLSLLAKQYEKNKMHLYTEGLYQSALSLANQTYSPIDDYNNLHTQISYGNFLLSQHKRSEEGNRIIESCRNKLKDYPHWYPQLSSMYYLKYNFNTSYTLI